MMQRCKPDLARYPAKLTPVPHHHLQQFLGVLYRILTVGDAEF